ncbi:c-type cytochrome [Elioraea rosea]|uniref:c-type cytochrome n=1 Tax=Elioraea rosea TaxID=2492390 RepID=UPI001182237F|nr:c-type cytochrome [Elioraea rosea]
MRWMILALTLGLALPAAAQDPLGDPVSGARIAERWCTGCHAVGPTRGPATDGAPTLRSIAEMPSTTAMSLNVFLRTPHGRMPDLSLTRDETDDLVAYILGLRSR